MSAHTTMTTPLTAITHMPAIMVQLITTIVSMPTSIMIALIIISRIPNTISNALHRSRQIALMFTRMIMLWAPTRKHAHPKDADANHKYAQLITRVRSLIIIMSTRT